jgi:hypothetical protein
VVLAFPPPTTILAAGLAFGILRVRRSVSATAARSRTFCGAVRLRSAWSGVGTVDWRERVDSFASGTVTVYFGLAFGLRGPSRPLPGAGGI